MYLCRAYNRYPLLYLIFSIYLFCHYLCCGAVTVFCGIFSRSIHVWHQVWSLSRISLLLRLHQNNAAPLPPCDSGHWSTEDSHYLVCRWSNAWTHFSRSAPDPLVSFCEHAAITEPGTQSTGKIGEYRILADIEHRKSGILYRYGVYSEKFVSDKHMKIWVICQISCNPHYRIYITVRIGVQHPALPDIRYCILPYWIFNILLYCSMSSGIRYLVGYMNWISIHCIPRCCTGSI
jgi:hypothetical protein